LGRTTDKLAINWQNFAQVELHLGFAFRIRPLKSLEGNITTDTNGRIQKANLSRTLLACLHDQNKSGFFGRPAFIQPIKAI